MGLRELKKQKTRKIISDLATTLFIKKGYNEVTMAEVAAAAEVSVSTVFNYFPTKESLVFDLEDEIDSEIVATIRSRQKNQSILDALCQYFLTSELIAPANKKASSEFTKLIRSSPELTSYFRGMWVRYEKTLAKEIQNASKANKTEAECMASLILQAVSVACNSPSPQDTLNFAFKTLKNGWKS